MKNIWICLPISGESNLPIAVIASKDTRTWRIIQNLKSFFDQFKLDRRQYKIEIWSDKESGGTGSMFNVNDRCTQFINQLSKDNNYFIRRKKKWMIYADEPKTKKEKIIKAKKYKVKPIYHPALRIIIKSLVSNPQRHTQYDVIAHYLHEQKYPIPNTATRHLYMETLFKHLQLVANNIATEEYEAAMKNKIGVKQIVEDLLDIPDFWASKKTINIICSKMVDLNSNATIRFVEAV